MSIFKYYICIVCHKTYLSAGKELKTICCKHRIREITKQDYKVYKHA